MNISYPDPTIMLVTQPGGTTTNVRLNDRDGRTVAWMDLDYHETDRQAAMFAQAAGLMTDPGHDRERDGPELAAYGHRGRRIGAPGESSAVSLAQVRMRGSMIVSVRQLECDMYYQVQQGQGYLTTVHGTVSLAVGETVFVPRRRPYMLGGWLGLLAVAAPAWRVEQEQVLPRHAATPEPGSWGR